MAIRKLPSGNYQARLQGPDGKIVTNVFPTKLEAEQQVLTWRKQKKTGKFERTRDRLTLNQFFAEWFEDASSEELKEKQSGWRAIQKQYFRDYIAPVLGQNKLRSITPQMVKRVLIEMAKQGRSTETQRLVFATIRKVFSDAVENYQYLQFNPATKKIKPKTQRKEAPHLNLEQLTLLLDHVENRKYGLAIWMQLLVGLRVGELIALHWDDIDVSTGRITVRRTFVKKTGVIRDYPKGGKQHSHALPQELLTLLREAKLKATSPYVVTSPLNNALPYKNYLRALKKYCKALGLPKIGTHGLRHSTSELYMHHGATKDDLRSLFAHSSAAVTDRYVHGRGGNLDKVANVIRLFKDEPTTKTDHATESATGGSK